MDENTAITCEPFDIFENDIRESLKSALSDKIFQK